MPCEPTVEPATVKSTAMEPTAAVKSAAMESTAAAVKSAATTAVCSFGLVWLEKRGSEHQSSCGSPQNLSYLGPTPIFA
jgi:hypothetical protein